MRGLSGRLGELPRQALVEVVAPVARHALAHLGALVLLARLPSGLALEAVPLQELPQHRLGEAHPGVLEEALELRQRAGSDQVLVAHEEHVRIALLRSLPRLERREQATLP